MKFGRLEWAQLADYEPHVLCDTPQTSSSVIPSSFDSSTVILSHEKYDQLSQIEFSQNGHSTTHASSLGMHAYTASLKSPGF